MLLEAGGDVNVDLVRMLRQDELVRKISQVYTLRRLALGDVQTACSLLATMVAVHRYVTSQTSPHRDLAPAVTACCHVLSHSRVLGCH